jgi:DNA-binding transcriptional LysR family regulator
LSYLDSFPVFARVAELGSFTTAANHLRMPPTVVAQRMRQLERHLGVRLFNRSTRQLILTEHGRIFYEGAVKTLDAVASVEASISVMMKQPRGSIQVAAPLGIGRRLFGPAIPEFHDCYPDIYVSLRLSDRNMDILREGIDVGFRLGALKDSSLIARGILECERVFAASPDYLDRRGRPSAPAELLEHDCLIHRFPGAPEFRWPVATGDGVEWLRVAGPFDSDDGDVLTDLALAGCGIVLKPRMEIQDHLQSGALERILAGHSPTAVQLAAVYPHRQPQHSKSRLFVDFMIDRLRSWNERPQASGERQKFGTGMPQNPNTAIQRELLPGLLGE